MFDMTFDRQLVHQIPALRRYARALMRGDRDQADELVQDTLERALSRRHRWKGDDQRAWLFTIVHNLFVNWVRRQHRGPQFVPLMDHSPAPRHTDPGQGLALDDVQKALSELSVDQREILFLVVLEGLSYEQVAKVLDLPVGTVMSRLARARQRLREGIMSDSGTTLRRIK